MSIEVDAMADVDEIVADVGWGRLKILEEGRDGDGSSSSAATTDLVARVRRER